MGTESLALPGSPFGRMSVPFVFWYLLPGLTSIVVNLILPWALVSPSSLLGALSLEFFVVLLAGGLVAGFVMDSLKLYQFTPHYKSSRQAFLQDVATTLDVDENEALFLFEEVRLFAKLDSSPINNLEFEHSRWVMMNHTSKAFLVFALTWLALTLWWFQQMIGNGDSSPLSLGWRVGVALIALGFWLRLATNAHKQQVRSNETYLRFMSRNKTRVQQMLMSPQAPTKKAGKEVSQ